MRREVLDKITPLGLACAIDWPDAVEVLLSAGAMTELSEPDTFLVLYIACTRGSFQTIRCILDKLSRGPFLLQSHYPFHLERIQLSLQHNLNVLHRPVETLDNVIFSLAHDRRKFTEMAQRKLPSDHRYLLPSMPDAVLNRNVADIIEVLEQRKLTVQIHFPESISEHHESIYYTEYLTRSVAQSLWNAGFRDLDAVPCCVIQPSLVMFTFQKMCLPPPHQTRDRTDFAALFEWLGEKQCKFVTDRRTWSDDSTTVCGHLAGEALARYKEKTPPLDYLKDLLQAFVSTGEQELIYICHDRCKCACSLSGCTLIGVYFRSWLHKMRKCGWESVSQGIDFFANYFKRGDTGSSVVKEAITRIILFHMLNIEHTCCQLGKPAEDPKASRVQCRTGLPYLGNYHLKQRYPPKTVVKMNEDAAGTISRLETYVAQAMQRSANFKGDFSFFLMGLLLEWFGQKDRTAAKAQLKAARKRATNMEHGHKKRPKMNDPLREIRPSIEKWLREVARDRSFHERSRSC